MFAQVSGRFNSFKRICEPCVSTCFASRLLSYDPACFCIFPPWCLVQTLDSLEQSKVHQTASPRPTAVGFASKLSAGEHNNCWQNAWPNTWQSGRRASQEADAMSQEITGWTLHLQIAIVDQFYWGSFFPSLPDLLRLHHVLLDCNALEDLRGTRCKKEFSYSYNRNFWTWSSKMICAHISANAPVTGGVSRRPRSWAAEATGWEDIVRFWEGHIGIPWNPMRVHLGSCRNAVMQQLCSYALSLCFR